MSWLASLQLDWKPADQWNLWLRGEYRGKSPRFSGSPDNLSTANRAIYDAVGDIQGYHLFHLGGSYKVSKNVSLNANIFNLFNKDFRKFTQVNVNGTPTWVNQYFQGGQSVSGTTLPGRTLTEKASASAMKELKRKPTCALAACSRTSRCLPSQGQRGSEYDRAMATKAMLRPAPISPEVAPRSSGLLTMERNSRVGKRK